MRATADLTAAPAEIAAILGIQAGRRALRRQETTADDEQTVIVTTLWFPPDVAAQAPKLADSRPLPAGSLGYIAAATGNQAARVDEESSAAAASLDDAAVLGVPDGSPVLRTRVRYENAATELIAYSEAIAVAGSWRARTYTIAGS